MRRKSRMSFDFCSLLLMHLLFISPILSFAQEAIPKSNKEKLEPKASIKKLTEEQQVIHLLNRITFGPRPGDIERIKMMGWQRYLDQQLHPERITDAVAEEKLKDIESIHLTNAQIAAIYPPPQVLRTVLKDRGIELPALQNPADPQKQNAMSEEELRIKRREAYQVMSELGYKPQQQLIQNLQQAKILRAVYSERQLQEVMIDFWFNHFNVFANKGADRVLITSYERDVIRPNVFGKFEDLLRATAKSPAMLFYLDNWLSAAPNSKPLLRRQRGLNENYAREIMELHTLGVDGNYTQKDVQEVARCFTGWTIRNPRRGGEFYFNPNMHDGGKKIVLGTEISVGGGIDDGEKVIKLLAHHSSTAKFISRKLARKFVADNPPPSLVERLTQVFQKTDGDIREVLRALFTSPEFWSEKIFRAKIKTPFEMTISAVRALGADTNGGPQFHRRIAQMGEGLFLAQPPTGYSDTAEMWVNTGALLERMNFSLALAANQILGTHVDLINFDPSAKAKTLTQISDHYIKLLLHGQISTKTRATLDKNLASLQIADEINRAKIIGLILGSPEFQRQ